MPFNRTSAMMPTSSIVIYKEATAKVRLLERCLGYALSPVKEWRHDRLGKSITSFMRLWKGGGGRPKPPPRRSPLGPGLFCWRFTTAARHLPHTSALACFICQLNPNQKHLNPIPEVFFFDPTSAFCCWRAALRVGVACSARWPVVLARKLWAQTQTPTHPEPKQTTATNRT